MSLLQPLLGYNNDRNENLQAPTPGENVNNADRAPRVNQNQEFGNHDGVNQMGEIVPDQQGTAIAPAGVVNQVCKIALEQEGIAIAIAPDGGLVNQVGEIVPDEEGTPIAPDGGVVNQVGEIVPNQGGAAIAIVNQVCEIIPDQEGTAIAPAGVDVQQLATAKTSEVASILLQVSTVAIALIISFVCCVPGGYDDKGIPYFINTAWFQLFVATSAIAFGSILLSIVLLGFVQLTHHRLAAQKALKYGIALQVTGIISTLIMQAMYILIAYEGMQVAVIPIIISLIVVAVIPLYVTEAVHFP